MFRFKCKSCEQWHEGVPAISADMPLYCYYIPEHERDRRCDLSADTCVIDGEFYFVRACLEIPVLGLEEHLEWGVWVSLSHKSFDTFQAVFNVQERSHHGPFFGWLSASIEGYPETENLKTKVHLRDRGIRPFIELEPTDHPLAVEQREGISEDRLAAILSKYMHC